jgi:NAD(P)-dependent dehydrogenase (short-subunit alcohol dehydrogenase family)
MIGVPLSATQLGRSRGYRIRIWNDNMNPASADNAARIQRARRLLKRRPQMPSPSEHARRSAAVTGAGGGLGRDIALGLAAKGYVVFGTAMTATEVHDLKDASGGRVSLTVCDMTREPAVKAWAGGVSDALGDSGLDLLINNAGILTPGPIEVLPLDAIRREFDVNVFGALSVMNAFLPALRKARGRIVQVSTWTASVPLPFNGPSGASKAAMEVFAAVYRAELKSFGVDVVVAAAGNMRTGGPAKTAAALARVADDMTAEQRGLYGESFNTFASTLNGMQSSGLDSNLAARRVIELAEQVPAPSRAPVGTDADEMLRAAREKSDDELDALRLRIVGLG